MTINKIDPIRYPQYFHEVIIPEAEVLTLNTIPVTLVRAPGAGLAIVPTMIVAKIGAGDAYATTTVLDITYTDESGNAIASTGAAFIAKTAKSSQILSVDQVTGDDIMEENAPVVISAGGAVTNAGTGASVTIQIWFYELPIA